MTNEMKTMRLRKRKDPSRGGLQTSDRVGGLTLVRV
jgi:hypothetical protein